MKWKERPMFQGVLAAFLFFVLCLLLLALCVLRLLYVCCLLLSAFGFLLLSDCTQLSDRCYLRLLFLLLASSFLLSTFRFPARVTMLHIFCNMINNFHDCSSTSCI